MSNDYTLLVKENGEKVAKKGTPDALLIDMFVKLVGRNSNFCELHDEKGNVITTARSDTWQFLLSNAKHYVIEVRNSITKHSLYRGPATTVVAALRGTYDDFAKNSLELVAYPTWDEKQSTTTLCDNTKDTFTVLDKWFEYVKPEVGEKQKAQTDWKGLYVNAELERIENLIQMHDTDLAMSLIRKLVENVQK